MPQRKPVIGVVGGRDISSQTRELAREVGNQIAINDAVLVCGGLGGVMEAAAEGARERGGTVLGILPTENKDDANPYVDFAIPTGMGIGRNVLVVRTSDVLIAFPGSYGTLSEIGLALNMGKTVVRLPGAWDIAKAGAVEAARYKDAYDAGHAVGLALGALPK